MCAHARVTDMLREAKGLSIGQKMIELVLYTEPGEVAAGHSCPRQRTGAAAQVHRFRVKSTEKGLLELTPWFGETVWHEDGQQSASHRQILRCCKSFQSVLSMHENGPG